MSYSGYFYSPYYTQQQQQSSGHTPSSYSQQGTTSASQFQTSQLPSIAQSTAQTTPATGTYDTSTYPSNYDSYSRTESRSDQSQRGGSRTDYSGYAATSRADDGSGYGNSSYAPTARNETSMTDSTRRPEMQQSSRDSYGSDGNGQSTSYSRSDYQKPENRTTSYQYPSTHTSTNIAHAAPYTQASHTAQPSRRQSVRSPLMYSGSYDATQAQTSAQKSDESARSYQLPSISKASDSMSQEHRHNDSRAYNQRGDQPSPHPINLPSHMSQSVPQQVPQPVPTPEPRTHTPQQVYREDRSSLHNVNVASQNEENRVPQKQKPQPQPKKPRPSQPKAARNKDTAQGRSTSTKASNAPAIRTAPNAINAPQQSPIDTQVQEQPATVDPSRVFNQYEYQRRKDAIEAESRAAKEAAEKAKEDARQVEDAERARLEAARRAKDEAEAKAVAAAKAKEEEETQRKVRREEEEARKKQARAEEEGRRRHATASSSTSGSAALLRAQAVEASLASPPLERDSSHADAIKALFGSMFDQMRDLKAKDPTLFSEVWENFKKVIEFLFLHLKPFSDMRHRLSRRLVVHLRRNPCQAPIKPPLQPLRRYSLRLYLTMLHCPISRWTHLHWIQALFQIKKV